jgi:hypothetical protein
MNMQLAITKKPPSTMPAVAMKRPDIMPTSRMVTTCMPRIMRKKPQSITPKSTVPSKNSPYEQASNQGSWNELKGKLKQQYGNLTDDDLVFSER